VPEPRRTPAWADLASVSALILGFVVSVGLAFAAFGVALCSLFGEQCTPEEEQLTELLTLASVVVFFAVPVVVALVRQQARWLLAPLVEAALIAAIVYLNGAF
jgi:hypothetical protein